MRFLGLFYYIEFWAADAALILVRINGGEAFGLAPSEIGTEKQTDKLISQGQTYPILNLSTHLKRTDISHLKP